MSVLVIDASKEFCTIVERALASQRVHTVLFAASAEEAFDVAGFNSKAGIRKNIDLVVVDTALPDISGIEVCRRFKAVSHFVDTPFIVVASVDDVNVLKEAFDAGAHDFIAKPVSEIELLARIRAALSLKKEIDRRNEQADELLRIGIELSEANEKLKHLSLLDGLTGISNRRGFDEAIEVLFAHSIRAKKPISMILIDIDYFKLYNDTHGHLAGDDCLRMVAKTIRATVRRKSDMVARYGGEEFVVVMPDTGVDNATSAAEDIRAAVEGKKLPHGSSRASDYVTISSGVASILPAPKDSADALFALADEALYDAKHNGRNRVETIER
ncbi:MAG: diguanylate cyclase [Deltaproteobacteria bacterium]|nr:diguanylate cyclase [Deltaproteobacteria bacterium]